ncbi:MAG: DNA primase [Sphingobium sp.]|nr:DNA primase [Sphingobium sp.]
MSLSPQFLDELRARTTLSTLLGKTIKVQKAGREYKACCPFHNEKTPSFTINDEKGFYHCFGCGAHGDAIRWMTEQRGLPFIDAVKELADAAGMEMPAADPRAAQKAKQARGLHEAMQAAQDWFEAQLAGTDGAEARAYLNKRGITDATRRSFGFGFAPDSRGKLKSALKDFPTEMLVEAGLLIQPDDKGREAYDRFRGRLMLPIRDARGRVIAFGGRIIGEGEPKYLNSPDTPLFDKGRTLYNLDKAASAARRADRVIVVEGYMDVIALAQAGIEEAVAPLGTALTEHQLERLWKMVDVPLLCFDGDNAGQKAANRAALRALPLLKPGQSLNFVTLPGGMDPDDLIKAKGAKGFEGALLSPRPLVEQIWQHEKTSGDVTSPEGRAGLQQRTADHAAVIADELVRKEYQRALRGLFWDEFGWKKQEIQAARSYISITRQEISSDKTSMMKRIDMMIKRGILLGISRYPSALYSHREQITRISMPTPALRQWVALMVQASIEHDPLEEPLISAILRNELTPLPERRNLKHDLAFSFFRKSRNEQARLAAEKDLKDVIEIILFEQEYSPVLKKLSETVHDREQETENLAEITEHEWQERLKLIINKRKNDERLRELKANIEEQLLAA